MKYFISSYKIVYGAVAALPIFLLWIYISWVIVLTGAIVTATLGELAFPRQGLNGPPALRRRGIRTGSVRTSR
jgi:uncharacterized BrkB/YihY/UPF0761 family membrane protein